MGQFILALANFADMLSTPRISIPIFAKNAVKWDFAN